MVGREDQIEAATADLLVQHRRGFDVELEFDMRLGAFQALHRRNKPRVENRLDRAEAQRETGDAVAAQLVFEVVLQGQQAFRVGQEAFAGAGEPEQPVAPVEQRRADFLLEHGDAAGDRGLGEEQFFCRAADALQAGDPDEGFDEAQIHDGLTKAIFLDPADCSSKKIDWPVAKK